MRLYLLVNAFIFGSLAGSFLNVVILRMPSGKSVVLPRSACPSCGFQLKWYHNIPILSFLFLRGKCSNCKTKISYQYPLVEFVMGALAVLIFPDEVNDLTMVYYLLNYFILAALFAQFIIDVKFKLLLDKINLFILAIVLPMQILSKGYVDPLMGGLIGFLFPLSVSWVFYKLRGVIGLGGGDIKIFGVLGVLLGLKGIILNIFVSCLIGSIFSLLMIALKKMKADNAIAFGPFIISVATFQYFLPDYFNMVMGSILK